VGIKRETQMFCDRNGCRHVWRYCPRWNERYCAAYRCMHRAVGDAINKRRSCSSSSSNSSSCRRCNSLRRSFTLPVSAHARGALATKRTRRSCLFRLTHVSRFDEILYIKSARNWQPVIKYSNNGSNGVVCTRLCVARSPRRRRTHRELTALHPALTSSCSWNRRTAIANRSLVSTRAAEILDQGREPSRRCKIFLSSSLIAMQHLAAVYHTVWA